MEADTVKCNRDKEEEKKKQRDKGKRRFPLGAPARSRGKKTEEGTEMRARESTKGANINATLQTADVAPITNLILPSQPVLSFLSAFANREGETRRHMPYSNLPHPVAFTILLASPPRPSSFHSHLSAPSLNPAPRGDDIGYTWRKGRVETHGRHGRHRRDGRETAKLNETRIFD